MRYAVYVPALIVIASLALTTSVQAKTPPDATFKHVSKFPVARPPSQFELVQQVIALPPATSVALNVEGDEFGTVLEGEVSMTLDGAEKLFNAGDTWVVPAGHTASTRNAGPDPARLVTTVLLPATSVAPAAPEADVLPIVVYESRTFVADPPATFDLFQVDIELAPGAQTPPHSHGGLGLFTFVQGTVSVTEDCVETRYGAGDTRVETPGGVGTFANAGSTTAGLVVSFVLPPGAALRTVATAPPVCDAQPSLPVSASGQNSHFLRSALIGGTLVVIALLVGLALLLRRARAKRPSRV